MWDVIVLKGKVSNSAGTAGKHYFQCNMERSCKGSKQVYIWWGREFLYNRFWQNHRQTIYQTLNLIGFFCSKTFPKSTFEVNLLEQGMVCAQWILWYLDKLKIKVFFLLRTISGVLQGLYFHRLSWSVISMKEVQRSYSLTSQRIFSHYFWNTHRNQRISLKSKLLKAWPS